MTMRRALLAVFALLAPAAAAAEMQGVLVAVRASRDVGKAYVPRTESGIGVGAGISLVFGSRSRPWEAGVEANIAGYESSGDGDPILVAALTIGRRFLWGDPERSRYLYVGTGWGGVFLTGNDEAAVPVRVAIGLQLGRGRALGADLSLYNRLTLIPMGDFPGGDVINSTGIQVAIRFGK
jgi:hypothetical protein